VALFVGDQKAGAYSSIVKSDSSLLFKKLNELNICHRVIMTGVGGLIRLLWLS